MELSQMKSNFGISVQSKSGYPYGIHGKISSTGVGLGGSGLQASSARLCRSLLLYREALGSLREVLGPQGCPSKAS